MTDPTPTPEPAAPKAAKAKPAPTAEVPVTNTELAAAIDNALAAMDARLDQAMTERWTARPLFDALTAALGELDAIPKGRKATIPGKEGKAGYSYEYADLADVFGAVRPVLAKHGLAVVQDVTNDSGKVSVSTLIIHRSGEQLTLGPLSLPASGSPQALGSAITYARRYALLAALGIATEDDDGQAAAHTPPQRTAPPPEPWSDPTPIPEDETDLRVWLTEALNAITPGGRRVQAKKDFVTVFGASPAEVVESLLPAAVEWMVEEGYASDPTG